jgi:PIN domain nuclease of toxin-antitoxin system
VSISAATIWEAGIKASLGRLDVGSSDLVAEIEANNFRHLPISARHAWLAAALPQHHSDPFDRMLVAQASSERLVLVTRDPLLEPYEVSLLEA